MPECIVPDLSSPLLVANVKLRNRVLLAPMSGVTDVPFRQLAWEHGAGMVISEMVASEAFVTGKQEMKLKSASAGLPLHVVQLAGREPQWMAKAAKLAAGAGAGIIDINMGCPAKKVTTGYSGAGLMRDIDRALRLIEATVQAVDVPVTLKMRLGWDNNSLNAPALAGRAVSAGVQMITVHGRTRCQFYNGAADWGAVRAVREAVDVPLIVNGDIASAEHAYQALSRSGADAVMVGRGAYGAPWLAGAIANGREPRLSAVDLAKTAQSHFARILAFYGTDHGIRQARKHIGWYMDRRRCDLGLRRAILTSYDPVFVADSLQRALECGPMARAA